SGSAGRPVTFGSLGRVSGGAGGSRFHGKGVDRAVLEALPHGVLDQAVLLDPAEALELRRPDDRSQVVAAALVHDLHLGAGQGGLDHAADLIQVGHASYPDTGAPPRAASTISSTRTNLTRGR